MIVKSAQAAGRGTQRKRNCGGLGRSKRVRCARFLNSCLIAAGVFASMVAVANCASSQQTSVASGATQQNTAPSVGGQAPPVAGQGPPPQSGPKPPSDTKAVERRVGGFVPGQKRPPGDPAQIARGKTLFEVNCRGCHGPDLRGGDLGGPNLLRSQVALTDQDGELIVPIIQGSRKNMGMPAIGLSAGDAKAVAAYVRSVIELIGEQGTPPSAGREAPSVLVGNASEGKAYFAVKCSSCHSPTRDLQGIASKIPDPKRLQTTWVAGGRDEPSGAAPREPSARSVMATVTLLSGESVEGQLVRIDDFLVTVQLADGTLRTLRRDGGVPQVVLRDPMKKHRELMAEYTDKDIHDVTAYLVTLK